MKLLAIEAGGATAAVAALQTGDGAAARPLAVTALKESRALSRSLITAIDATLQQAGWALDDVDSLGVGIGPGSWTSLRIAISTAKTLVQARGWHLAGIPTFDAVAAAVWRVAQEENELPDSFLLLVTARSRPGEIYGKIYVASDDYLALVQPEWLGSPQMMADTLGVEAMARGIESPFVLAGDAATPVGEILDSQNEPHLRIEMPVEAVAIEIGRAAQVAIEAGEESSPLELQPLYLAPSAAERNLAR